MALTAQQEITICQMFAIAPEELTFQINWLGALLTTAQITAIGDQITLWNAGAGTKTTKLFPVESNKGVKTDPDAARNNIKRNIASLLRRKDWATSGSGNYLPRG